MNRLPLAARRCAAVVLLAPLACSADGLLRGSLPAARESADPAGVQITALPSGALMKRMPGQGGPGDAASARETPLPPGVSVQTSGAALMRVMAGQPAESVGARPSGLTSRQAGGAMLLEMPGQRLATERAAAPPAAALPAGVRIVVLSATEPLPANPQPHTLYRRSN